MLINKSLFASDRTQSITLTEKLTASVVSLFRLQREREKDNYWLGEIHLIRQALSERYHVNSLRNKRQTMRVLQWAKLKAQINYDFE